MNKKQFLKSLRDVNCRLAPTVHGVGVVAIRPIPKGINPFKNCDPFGTALKITKAELEKTKVPEAVKKMVRDYCVFQNGVYFVPSYGIDAVDKSFFSNHSRKPNMKAIKNGESFKTTRRIKTGEELTADYRDYDGENRFKL